MHTLGWIGLGHMGAPMALNLLKAGYQVNVYNRSIDKTEALVDAGANRLDSPKEVAEQSDIVFVMLSNTDAVQSVLADEFGVLQGISPGKIIVDMSTIAPGDSIKFAAMTTEKGAVYLDAPVSGSVAPAENGQLVVLVGGEKENIDTCVPYFDVLGKETIHFGETGKGSAAKLAINLLLGIVGQGIAETLLFAEKSGLDKENVLQMITQSAVNTTLFQGKTDMYRKEVFPAAFMIELISKDLGLVKAEADRLETTLPLAEATNTTYREAKENGKEKLDMAAIYLELKEKNNTNR